MRKTYLDSMAYEADAIERAKSGEDEDQQALNDAPWDAEQVIVPM